ncbi:hypothetical protein E2542_SST23701 [Spatholobus suberectus]|nr:hypothetical protein E2542_SST23701 [Spatholobus suberectus]
MVYIEIHNYKLFVWVLGGFFMCVLYFFLHSSLLWRQREHVKEKGGRGQIACLFYSALFCSHSCRIIYISRDNLAEFKRFICPLENSILVLKGMNFKITLFPVTFLSP